MTTMLQFTESAVCKCSCDIIFTRTVVDGSRGEKKNTARIQVNVSHIFNIDRLYYKAVSTEMCLILWQLVGLYECG